MGNSLIVTRRVTYRAHSKKKKTFIKFDCLFSEQVVFEGVRGKNFQGDIAIDDIVLKNGFCPSLKACSFEDVQMCGWTNEKR